MMLTLGGCGSAANTANKKEATQTTAEQTASSQEDTAEAAAKETELDVLKIGLAALPTQLDPDRSIGIASIKLFYNIFDTLLFTDKEGNITGQLADSWEWQDDTTLNVKIRENVTFQNGEVCDAEDVKFTFDRILSGYGDGTIAVLYETLDSVEKIDDLTVQFKLKNRMLRLNRDWALSGEQALYRRIILKKSEMKPFRLLPSVPARIS